MMTFLLKCFGRWWPFTRGRTRLFLFFFKDKQRRKFLDKLPELAVMKRGYQLYAKSGEFTSLWFRLYGSYEDNSINTINEELKNGGTFLDIGANLGLYAMDVAKNTSCPVIAFEPNPGTAVLANRSIALNGFEDRIYLKQAAVGNANGRLEFLDNIENAGDSALLQEGNAQKEGSVITVDVIAIDEDADIQARLAKLPPVKAVKMDIQGAEVQALRGMSNLLRKDKPVMLIEFSEESLKEFNSSTEELLAVTRELGYKPDSMHDGNMLFRPA